MRPIHRGSAPLNADGTPKRYRHYQNARRDLIDRLGDFCSYCEQKLETDLAIEHVCPRSCPETQHLECSWENFLLACRNCNSIKRDTPITPETLDEYLWPDRDNTFLALSYSEGGIVSCNPALPEAIQEKAQRLIHLVGLDRIPGHIDSKASDRRWEARRKEWNKAMGSRADLKRCDIPEFRRQIVRTASCHFSIWLTVFADDSDMCLRLIQAFSGTARDCFDDQGRPIPRHPEKGI